MSNLKIDELRMFARGRNIDSYQNMFREQLERLFITPPVRAPIYHHTPVLRRRSTFVPRVIPTTMLRPRNVSFKMNESKTQD